MVPEGVSDHAIDTVVSKSYRIGEFLRSGWGCVMHAIPRSKRDSVYEYRRRWVWRFGTVWPCGWAVGHRGVAQVGKGCQGGAWGVGREWLEVV